VPLVLNLQRRAETEAERIAQTQAQTIAADLGSRTPAERSDLEEVQELVDRYADIVEGRIVVVDEDGIVVADSAGPEQVGVDYATPARPEVITAVEADQPASDQRYSEVLRQDILATAVPVFVRGRPEGGAVRITTSLAPVQANVRQTTIGLAAIGFAGFLAGLILAFVLARSFSRPLSTLATAAHRLGRGDLTARTGGVRGAREIEETARAFDEMAARLEDTVRAQREFVANASHQLRTPLTGVKLRLEAAMSDPEASPSVKEQLEAADREVDRLAGIVERLLVLARHAERGGEHVVDVRDAADRAARRFAARASQAGATLEVVGDGGLAVADQGDLDQVLDALIDNAFAHGAPPIVVEAGRSDGRVSLAVRDHGAGIPEEDLPRVTERFYRGQGAAPGGSGLGLAIVSELVERWGGSVDVARAEGGGTRVSVSLPAADV
jgi:signal transduction histidine kinase